MIKKNDEKIGEIVSVGSNGEGICKDEGLIIFIPFALVGERVKYRVLKVTQKFAYAKLIEVLSPSEMRISAKCPVFTKCGGCQLQHIDYQNQLKIKEENISSCFSKIANINITVNPTVTGENQFRYRNKIQLPVCFDGKRTNIGFYAENSHRVIPIDDCLINPYWTSTLISCFKKYIEEFNIRGYSEFDGKGIIREITAREVDNNLIICVVVNEKLPSENRLIDILKNSLENNFSLFINVNKKKTNVIYGDDFKLIYGQSEYTAEMLGVKFKMGVRSFMQVNTEVCKKLYSSVNELAKIDKDTVVVDAYSGAGLMTALLAKSSKKAYGIEIIPEAVELADALAKENELSNKITNINGKCEEIMPDIIAENIRNSEKITVILDPPRKGCDLPVINAVKDSMADTVVYVSCNPSTLARDVGLICGTLFHDGKEIKKVVEPKLLYEVKSVTPFDLFCQTKHIETLVCLARIR